jgi:hypothetical protein
MSVRIAIIGTSHVSALALGWHEICEEWPDASVTFFAAPGWNFRRLQLNADKQFGILDNALFEPNEVRLLEGAFGMTKLSLTDFDAVLHVGQDIYESDLVSLLAQFSVDELRPTKSERNLSVHAFELFSEALADQALLPKLWHHWDSPKLFVLPAPRCGESCTGAQGPIYEDWAALMTQKDSYPHTKSLLAGYGAKVGKHYKGAGINFLSAPASVLGKSGLTRARFTHSSRQLTNVMYSATDHKHMNMEYGRIVLNHVLKKIAASFGLPLPLPLPDPAPSSVSVSEDR